MWKWKINFFWIVIFFSSSERYLLGCFLSSVTTKIHYQKLDTISIEDKEERERECVGDWCDAQKCEWVSLNGNNYQETFSSSPTLPHSRIYSHSHTHTHLHTHFHTHLHTSTKRVKDWMWYGRKKRTSHASVQVKLSSSWMRSDLFPT